MSRIVWVDAGNASNPAKLKPLRAQPCYDIRDPHVTAAFLGAEHADYGGVGVYLCSQGAGWPGPATMTGEEWADWASDELKGCDLYAPDAPRVCLDIETHDVPWLLAALKRWRQHRPRRVTDWTLEGFQGGLFSRADALVIAGFNVGIAPSFYRGNMEPHDAVAVALDLCVAGFPPSRIVGMYDAAHLPPDGAWSGYAFTQGRLP